MILLLSNHGDYSADIVIDHLKMLGADCIRINSFDLLDYPLEISAHSKYIKVDGQTINPKDIGAVWFRKFGFFRKSRQYKNMQKVLEPTAQSYLSTEFSKVIEVFEFYFKDSFWLTNPRKINVNKFIVLEIAKDLGFTVPPTYIVNNKFQLSQINQEEGVLISKSIYDPLIIFSEGSSYSMYTTLIDECSLNDLPRTFMPSMVQKAIPKQFEVRVFYLMGRCYSMAIMSQEDAETSIDYRKYDFNNPNRFIPIQLPSQYEQKINQLMSRLSLNTGSIDFIFTPDDQLVFLEVNPTGQFGMVDYSCNYGLHNKVAEVLIKKDIEYHEKNA
ncbi:grasp-with-spasm system ATP-grasp peptide maturase [Porphyromonadaceae bacterium W3.11]|nr:grasp-with-spasm system ATP-grasp peptide maturase [Porphyromonadaceae bacterium W3.11]